ncbi:hypothetical protein GOP47_0019254, partial [Adiantum capillus-veneris]
GPRCLVLPRLSLWPPAYHPSLLSLSTRYRLANSNSLSYTLSRSMCSHLSYLAALPLVFHAALSLSLSLCTVTLLFAFPPLSSSVLLVPLSLSVTAYAFGWVPTPLSSRHSTVLTRPKQVPY